MFFMFEGWNEVVEDMRKKDLIDIVAIPTAFIEAMEDDSERDTDTT